MTADPGIVCDNSVAEISMNFDQKSYGKTLRKKRKYSTKSDSQKVTKVRIFEFFIK